VAPEPELPEVLPPPALAKTSESNPSQKSAVSKKKTNSITRDFLANVLIATTPQFNGFLKYYNNI
jgi:hypothetical protein